MVDESGDVTLGGGVDEEFRGQGHEVEVLHVGLGVLLGPPPEAGVVQDVAHILHHKFVSEKEEETKSNAFRPWTGRARLPNLQMTRGPVPWILWSSHRQTGSKGTSQVQRKAQPIDSVLLPELRALCQQCS